jgi:hypothetical protein
MKKTIFIIFLTIFTVATYFAVNFDIQTVRELNAVMNGSYGMLDFQLVINIVGFLFIFIPTGIMYLKTRNNINYGKVIRGWTLLVAIASGLLIIHTVIMFFQL